jgi:hypothetical protein
MPDVVKHYLVDVKLFEDGRHACPAGLHFLQTLAGSAHEMILQQVCYSEGESSIIQGLENCKGVGVISNSDQDDLDIGGYVFHPIE